MESAQIAGWSRRELRLAYYDFTLRGEGEASVVRSVIRKWRSLNALAPAEARLWLDAVEWRESGHALPGWHMLEAGTPSARALLAETATWFHFEAWRIERRRRAEAA